MTRNVSIYNGVKDITGVAVRLDKVIARIRSGAKGLDDKTQICQILAQTDPDKYSAFKEKLPAVTWSGRFEKRKANGLIEHSGHLVLDFDDIDVGSLLADLVSDPHVYFAFVSPSAAGVKAVVKVDSVPGDAAEHKHAFEAVKAHFEQYGEIDPSGSDVSRLCFLAHYPQAIYTPDATPIAWEIPETETAERRQSDWTGDVDTSALDFIDADDYETWLMVGMACHHSGVSLDVWDRWSEKSEKYVPGACAAKWRSFATERDETVTWGSVVHLAKENGYAPPRFIRKPVKLQKNVVSVITETLEKSREFLKSVFADQKIRFFGLRADTGVGKSEGMIAFLMRGFRATLTVPTTDLAKEQQARLDKAEIDSFRYRGIKSNPDGTFPDENPCIHAGRYDAIASRGWNAYELLCESCEVREMCEDRGYRSQAEAAKKAQVTVMPFPDIFLNPAFRTLAKAFLPNYDDDLIMHDEFAPYNAFLEINVPKSQLVRLRDDWKGYDPSIFAKDLLRILESEGDLSQLRPLVMSLNDDERNSLMEGLTCVMWRGQVLSREDAHRCAPFRAQLTTVDTIQGLPRLETEDWNLLVQLELFFERYGRDADMPMKYENDTLTFLLPPLPMKTRARMGFMSATLQETLFRRTFSSRQEKRADVAFHDTGLTEWHPEATVFQLRSNRNPRATVYNPKGERVDGELLSATGEFYWELVADDCKNEGRGVITYKALLEAQSEVSAQPLDCEDTFALRSASEKKDCLCEFTKTTFSQFGAGVKTANFGGLVGLDTHFKDVDVLHILFSPEVPPSAVEFKAKALFGDDTEPLCYDRDEDGHYIDTRLQACYADGVISELQQAIGRGRLVSKPIKVVVWCSHFLPGITDREQTLLFDEVDWQVSAEGDIEKLAAVVKAREAAEQHGDVQDYAKATGQSERTAYRRTEKARKASKADTDAELLRLILERKAEGIGERKIATELGISYGKVRSLLKNNKVH